MKPNTHNTIKHWDDNLVIKFVNKELVPLYKHFETYGITSLSFVDIGGNVGKFYDEISKNYNVNKYEVVEASSILCEYMKGKFKDNPNVTIHHMGLSDEEGIFYFGDEGIRYFETSGEDGSGRDINLGLSASHFIHHDNTNFHGATKFYSSYHFLEDMCTIPPQDLKFIKVDTENRDIQIVASMTDYLVKHKIQPIILFENNFRYFLSSEQAQLLIDNLCDKVGYIKVDLMGPDENIFLLPKI